jgi:hypothetical protein
MGKGTWWVVTIQRIDGHMTDGVFMTNDWEVIRRFSRKVHPLKVKCSAHLSRYFGARFVGRYFKEFELLDPDTYDLDLCE